MAQKARVIGAAGTGKTTELLRIMEGAKAKTGGDPMSIGLMSFTRAARQEAAERAGKAWDIEPEVLTHDGWIRTGHSICHRQLGIEPGQMITDSKADQKWVADQFGVHLSTAIDGDNSNQVWIGDARVAWSLNAWQYHRVTLMPLDEVIRHFRERDDSDAYDVSEVQDVAEKYESAKNLDDRYDFTDILLRFAGVSCSPKHGISRIKPEGELPPVKTWLFDEQQDASPLLDLVCRRLMDGSDVRYAYAVGDPFQCQPAGTPVLTTNGYKPIEELDPEADRLIAFNKKDGRFYGKSGSVRFAKATRHVSSGELMEIVFADGTKSICTYNHKWIVRTNRKHVFATYLMRKEDRWRIGTVQMFANHSSKSSADKNGDFRLKMRMNQEAADDVWILKTFGTDREARMYEQIASCRYGIPQVTFRPPHGKTNLDKDFIDTVFESLGDLSDNALRCLSDHNLKLDHPFSTKADRCKNGGKACRFIAAANLLPGIHAVPKLKNGFFESKQKTVSGLAEWVEIKSIRKAPSSQMVHVYSLEVPKHHTYVTTNGIVTGNSIYGFAGSSSACFLGWDVVKEKTMPRSYRCPAEILAKGEECLRKMTAAGKYWDRGVAPSGGEGSISEWHDLEDLTNIIDGNDDWLMIARTNFQATRIMGYLSSIGVPYRSTKSTGEPTIRQTGMAALFKLEKGEPINGEEWLRAIAILPSRSTDGEIIKRGTKKKWNETDEHMKWDFIMPDDIESVGGTELLGKAIQSGGWCKLVDHGSAWRESANRYGIELTGSPRIRVGTIHSAKGLEAENVAVLTTTSKRVQQSATFEDQFNEECRLAYVAVTRSSKNLHIINEGRQMTPRMEALA